VAAAEGAAVGHLAGRRMAGSGEGCRSAAGTDRQHPVLNSPPDEPADFKTFRIGLLGLDKLADVAGTVARLEKALDQVASPAAAAA